MTINEYDMVRLLCRLPPPDENIPIGARGAVLLIYDAGKAYEVEFVDDDKESIAVATVSADALEKILP